MSVVPFEEWDNIVQHMTHKVETEINSLDPFILVVDTTDIRSASLVVVAARLRLRCVLLHKGRISILDYVSTETNVTKVIQYDAKEDILVEKACAPVRTADGHAWTTVWLWPAYPLNALRQSTE
jgi:hypothetical protein